MPMSRSLSKLQALLLGLAVVLGVGLAAVGLITVASRQGFWSDHFHVKAMFPRIDGVEVGTRVRILGIDAGEVVEVEPPTQPGAEVLLRLRIQDKYRHLVREDATAQIVG